MPDRRTRGACPAAKCGNVQKLGRLASGVLTCEKIVRWSGPGGRNIPLRPVLPLLVNQKEIDVEGGFNSARVVGRGGRRSVGTRADGLGCCAAPNHRAGA